MNIKYPSPLAMHRLATLSNCPVLVPVGLHWMGRLLARRFSSRAKSRGVNLSGMIKPEEVVVSGISIIDELSEYVFLSGLVE